MPWGAAIAAGASIVGSSMQASAAKKAANAQARSADAAMAEQGRQFDVARNDLAPWRNAGKASVNQLRELMGLSPQQMNGGGGALYGQSLIDISSGVPSPNSELYESSPEYRKAWDEVANIHYSQYNSPYIQGSNPQAIEKAVRERLAPELFAAAPQGGQIQSGADGGEFGSSALLRKFSMDDLESDPVHKASFQFGLDEGTKAISRRLSATGMGKSGAAVKALTRFATDYTNQKAGESYNRFAADQDRVYNKLAGVAGTGQTATTSTAALGAANAANAGNLMVGAANARGAAGIASANAYSNALGTAGSGIQRQFILNDFYGRGSSAPASNGASFSMDEPAYQNFG